ncbi:MAG: tRNA1(Val) (adenine(37)-N6)-methyltransferase [Desulfopila sp.]
MGDETGGCDSPPTTNDTLFAGALRCRQHRRGYRFSVDAVLAAHFHRPAPGETVLDLGAGCGIIALIVMYRWGELLERVDALEYQPQLCRLIEENFRQNDFLPRCRCLQGDVKDILASVGAESYSTVICNPPYYKENSGRKSVNTECLIARHQIAATIDDFIGAASLAVKNRGVVVFIYPASLLASLCASLERHHLEIKRLQCIYSYPQRSVTARLVRLECVKNGGPGAEILAPLYIYEAVNGPFSSQMQRLYAP